MTRTPTGILAALVFMAVLSLPAEAGFYLGFQGGFSSQKAKLDGISFDRDQTFLYGARAGVNVLALAFEVQWLQAAHNLDFQDITPEMWKNRELDYSHLGLCAKFFLPLPVLQPYLSLGYGYYWAHIPGVESEKERGFNAGAGLEIRLARKFALAAEARYHRVGLGLDEGKLTLGNLALAGGFNIYF